MLFSRSRVAYLLPVLIFGTCAFITTLPRYQSQAFLYSYFVAADLLLTAPLAYWLVTRKKTFSKPVAFRLVLIGAILGTLLLPTSNPQLAGWIRGYLLPVMEVGLAGWMLWKFRRAAKGVKAKGPHADFLDHCRQLLEEALGSKRAAQIMASEVAVFYYALARRKATGKECTHFSVHRRNGNRLVLSTLLGLFFVEAAGMHLILERWNATAAWITTALSLYTCLQLFAHVRALALRPVVVEDETIWLRNGLLGGDVKIKRTNILQAECSRRFPDGPAVVPLFLVKGLEMHNVVLHLKEPVVVLKGFGIRKKARTICLTVDCPEAFLQVLQRPVRPAQ